MGLLNTNREPERFRVPALTEVDPAYAALAQKRAELLDRHQVLVSERRQLEKAIAADTSPEVPSRVAELLGDQPGSKALNRKRAAELAREVGDIEAAVAVLDDRLTHARGAAGLAVCRAVRPEFARRVQALVDAMRQLDAAHQHFDELYNDLEAEDVSTGSLGQIRPFFLGASGEVDRHIARYIREVREAGYVS